MTEEHSSPIKTPRQLIIVVLLAFAVPITLAGLVSQLVTSGEKGVHEDDSKVLARIQPVANVVLAEASGPKGMLSGEQVYAQVCKTCHDAGLAGAPKLGDKAAWQARIAQGEATMSQHAIAGFQGKAGAMPAKGGNADLTDDEVRRAVAFMANKAGATWKEPAIAAPAATVAATPASAAPIATAAAAAPAPAPAAAAPAAAAAGKPDGKKDVRRQLRGVSCGRHCGRAEIRRQGRVGAARRARRERALHARDRRLPGQGRRDATEGRQRRAAGPGREGGRRLHGCRGQVTLS